MAMSAISLFGASMQTYGEDVDDMPEDVAKLFGVEDKTENNKRNRVNRRVRRR
jgi:hypothetical protein